MSTPVNQKTTISTLKEMTQNDAYKASFARVLGQKAPQFLASVVNATTGNTSLQACSANSIMSAAYVAATLDLPVDQNLGYSAIVPYKISRRDENGTWYKEDVAQFQMMYKGYIQLAIRTGMYEGMNVSEVYEDELEEFNPITGECKFTTDFSATKQRRNGEADKIVGYYGWFRLLSGFKKELYMSKEEVSFHATKYSTSYRNDIDKGRTSSRWSTDFDSMAKKTVIKLLLSKWGVLSIEMQKAIIDDQKTFGNDGSSEYGDNLKIDTNEEKIAQDPFAKEETNESNES